MTFFLPVIAPPDKLIANPLNYYNSLPSTVVVGVVLPASVGDPIQITVQDPNAGHPDLPSLPVSTVFAMTAGFVSYSSGELTLHVWTQDFAHLNKPTDAAIRPNRIVYTDLESGSVETAIRGVIAELANPILEEAWHKSEGTAAAPNRAGLIDHFWQKFQSGDNEVFVRAGTPLGQGSTTGNEAHITVRAFFQPAATDAQPQPEAEPASVEDLIDTATKPALLLKFTNHPLLKKMNDPITVDFQSRFWIWDNTPGDRKYVPLAGQQVALMKKPINALPSGVLPDSEVVRVWTDQQGRITLSQSLEPRAEIHFKYITNGLQFGQRTYLEDVETDSHKARQHLDNGINTRDYRAKYEVGPKYATFLDSLADNEADEKYQLDRGNMGEDEKDVGPLPISVQEAALLALTHVVPAVSERDFAKHRRSLEAWHKSDAWSPSATTFNVLFEGDSWLNYPFAYSDNYAHLDQLIWANTKPGVVYNRIPLQHYGDRTDHMFLGQGEDCQWHFTQEYLDEYDIDLIVLSAGGNDIAEPGISTTIRAAWSNYYIDKLFNPTLAHGALDTHEWDVAERLMRKSFAILLKNHPWHCYFNGTTPLYHTNMSAVLDPLLTGLGQNFGTPDPLYQFDNLQDIGERVIDKFPDVLGPLEAALVDAVFDPIGMAQRYDSVKTNLQVLLDVAKLRQIPVIIHTYGYPLFNELPSSYLGKGKHDVAGPWFHNRFEEAGIVDRRIRKICLKVILDKFITDILDPLTPDYPQLQWVDTRRLNQSTDVWRDEMHLRGPGYRKVAREIYDALAANPAMSDFLLPVQD